MNKRWTKFWNYFMVLRYTDEVCVERGRDWENQVGSTLLFTGLHQEGTTIWGKKIE